MTATAFVATLDDVHRFRDAGQVTSFLGLVPREYSSGERQHKGAITKTGDRHLRSLLVQAAWVVWRLPAPAAFELRAWARGGRPPAGHADRRGRPGAPPRPDALCDVA